jgi:hypothetical protein
MDLLGFITLATDGYLSVVSLWIFFLFLLFSFLMVVLTPHACWFLFHRVHASCDSFLFDFFSSVLTIQFAYLDGSLGSITWETDGYLCLLFLSGTRFFFVLMV